MNHGNHGSAGHSGHHMPAYFSFYYGKIDKLIFSFWQTGPVGIYMTSLFFSFVMSFMIQALYHFVHRKYKMKTKEKL